MNQKIKAIFVVALSITGIIMSGLAAAEMDNVVLAGLQFIPMLACFSAIMLLPPKEK